MTVRPRVALVGWKLGSEFEQAIAEGSDRFRYVVVSMVLDPEVRPFAEWHRLPAPRLGSFRLGWAEFFVRAGLLVARTPADLVHAVGPVPVVPNRVDLNTVTFCQAAFDEATAAGPVDGRPTRVDRRLGQRFSRSLERRWFRRGVRMLVGISEGGAEELRRHYPGVEVTSMPRGIDLERFRPDAETRTRMRRERAVGSDEVVALLVDQQHRAYKGVRVAIEGFAAAHRAGEGPDLLWVAGAGNERFASVAHQLGVGDRVRFLGHTAAVEDLYRAADMFVLPTAYEAFCRAAHEAAACGLPVVAPPVNGIRELIGDDEAGIVARRDPADVARALGALTRDPGLRRQMGAVARRKASAFDHHAAAREIVALHESLVTRPPRGTPA